MDTKELILASLEKVKSLEEIVPTAKHQRRIEDIDGLMSDSDIWDDNKKASALLKERQKLSDIVSKMIKFKEQTTFHSECLEACPIDLPSIAEEIADLHKEICDFETMQMLSGENDHLAAILSVNVGAGGLEASNFVTMLFRMYCRYANDRGWKIDIIDEQRSEEHSAECTDSISVRIEGEYAYGFLKGETGVMRLIRNSPYNAGNARQTSFAAVQVSPDIEDTIDIKIDEKDLEITSQTAGGPGGQNSNRVKSAIRIKHFPTGINVICRTERDQLSNKKTAFKILKAKLYDLEIKKQEEEQNKKIASLSKIAFGAQVRTFTLQPYTLVKDHRTEHENRNAQAVLDGDIHDFSIAYLQWLARNK